MSAESIIVFAGVFLLLFLVGGFFGALLLPVSGGLGFWVGGILLGAFGTGAGSLVVNAVVRA